MHSLSFPWWTNLPFGLLVFAIAVLPTLAPKLWERSSFQALLVALLVAPWVAYLTWSGRLHVLGHAAGAYCSFAVTIGALYIAASGIHVRGDLLGTPRTNVLFLLVGAVLASFIGTTGASMVLIRPFLRTNQQRRHTAHLVPLFIIVVANAGGLLTPLGDPPLLVGYLAGVPFFWTLRLFPIWAAYVLSACVLLYVFDRAAYARETETALRHDREEVEPLAIEGKRNLLVLALIVVAALLPTGFREAAIASLAVLSYLSSPRAVHHKNEFTFTPLLDVAIVFAGLFACLPPVEAMLAHHAPNLPLQHASQLFWSAGMLSAVLDNAPTYAAFLALGRGLSAGHSGLVAGVHPLLLAAISAGAVVMGATTYIGNGPNLMVKAVAERAKHPMMSFGRYAAFAFLVMLPAHLLLTVAFVFFQPF